MISTPDPDDPTSTLLSLEKREKSIGSRKGVEVGSVGSGPVGNDWRTPPEVLAPVREFARLDGLGGIALDPCSGPGSVVGATVEVVRARDGLSEDWAELAGDGLVWVNPPYSRDQVTKWLGRCAAHGQGHVIALVNARTSDGWWPSPWPPAVCFWRGRIQFLEPSGERRAGNPQPSALLYWGDAPALFEHVFAPCGRVVRT